MAKGIRARTYREVAEELDRAVEWIRSLGVKVEPSRVMLYRKAVNQIAEMHEAGREDIWQQVGLGETFNASFEVDELISIYRALGQLEAGPLLEKISQFVKGPGSYVDERPESSSNRARNIAFELAMASRFVRAGFELDLGSNADVLVRVQGVPLFVECKRPQRASQLHSNAKAALRQLRSRYARYPDLQTARGIVALSITKVVNPQALYLSVADESDLVAELRKVGDDFVAANHRKWRDPDDQRNIGSLIEFRCCAHVRSLNIMTVSSQVAVSYAGNRGSPNRDVALALAHAFSDGDFTRRLVD